MRILPALVVVCAAAVAGAIGAFAALEFVGPTKLPTIASVPDDGGEVVERLIGAEARVQTLLARVDSLQASLAETRESLESGASDPVAGEAVAPTVPGGRPISPVIGDSEVGPPPGSPVFVAEIQRLYESYQEKLRIERREAENARWRSWREDHGKEVVTNLSERLTLTPAQAQTVETLIVARNQRIEFLTAQRQEASDREEDFDFWTPYNEATKALTDSIRIELSSLQQASYDDLLRRGGYRALGGRNRRNR